MTTTHCLTCRLCWFWYSHNVPVTWKCLGKCEINREIDYENELLNRKMAEKFNSSFSAVLCLKKHLQCDTVSDKAGLNFLINILSRFISQCIQNFNNFKCVFFRVVCVIAPESVFRNSQDLSAKRATLLLSKEKWNIWTNRAKRSFPVLVVDGSTCLSLYATESYFWIS